MRFGIRLLTALPAVMLLLPLESASAQRRRGLADITPEPRHGFWFNAGIAAGSENGGGAATGPGAETMPLAELVARVRALVGAAP